MTNRFYHIPNRVRELKRQTMELFNSHKIQVFPRIEEDGEGIMTWENPKKCKMFFKEKSTTEGYQDTINIFKKARLIKYVRIYIEEDKVVVELP